MTVVLMNPFDPWYPEGPYNVWQAPLGIAYLAAATRAAGLPFQLIDGVSEGCGNHWLHERRFGVNGLTIGELVARVDAEATVIGVTCKFSHIYPPTRALVHALRKRFKKATIVLGGEGVSEIAGYVLNDAPVDAVVTGEGEEPFLAICEAVGAGRSIAGLPNVVTSTHGYEVAHDTKHKGRFDEADDLPFPAWDLIDLQPYWDDPSGFGIRTTPRYLPALASRGCPFKCKFCSAPGIWNTQRYRSVDNVVEELREFRDRFGVTQFIFNDLSMTTNIKWFTRFVEALDAANLGIHWTVAAGIRAVRISAPLLRLAKKTGLTYLAISAETGSPRIMEWIDKRMTLDSLEETVANAREAGLKSSANFIVGYPDETFDDYLDTLRFMRTLIRRGLTEIGITTFMAVPGSPYYNDLMARGEITLNDDYFEVLNLNDSKRRLSHNPRFTGQDLRILRVYGHLWFFSSQFRENPSLYLGALSRAARDTQSMKLDRYLRHDFGALVRTLSPALTPRSATMLYRLGKHMLASERTLSHAAA